MKSDAVERNVKEFKEFASRDYKLVAASMDKQREESGSKNKPTGNGRYCVPKICLHILLIIHLRPYLSERRRKETSENPVLFRLRVFGLCPQSHSFDLSATLVTIAAAPSQQHHHEL